MTVYAIGATSLTGGGVGALDAEHAEDIGNGDPAFVFVSGDKIYHFIADADSGAAESSPDVIAPDWESAGVAYTGDLRWIRIGVYGISAEEFTTALKNKLDGIEATADVTDAGNIAPAIHGASIKTVPANADEVGLIDSAASNVLKRITWQYIKLALKTYFDTLYNKYVLENHASNHVDGTDDIQVATGSQKGLATTAQIAKLDGIETGADVTANNPPQDHAASHSDGSDNVTPAASQMVVSDSGGFFTGSDGETVLQEIGKTFNTQVIVGFENNTDSVLSWDNVNRRLTLTPSGTTYYYIGSIRYSIDSVKTIDIADTSGPHLIHIDSSGTLQELVNPSHAQVNTAITSYALVAWVYWNTNVNDTVVLADERHGLNMSGATHHWLHDNIGAKFAGNGGTLSAYTLKTASDAAISFDLTNIDFYDEDLEHKITDGVAANQYEQVLTGDAEIPVLYRDDVDGTWAQQAASSLPYMVGGTPRLAYNKDDGDGTWSQEEIGNGSYMVYWLIVTNDWEYPVKMIQGSTEYSTKLLAMTGAATEVVNWGSLPAAEFVVMYQFIMHDGNGGTTDAEIETIVDFRSEGITGASYTPTAHGALSGLSDDDHLQYLLIDGTRAMTGTLDMGTQQINNVVDPALDQDAATKKYVDDQIAAALAKAAVLGTL